MHLFGNIWGVHGARFSPSALAAHRLASARETVAEVAAASSSSPRSNPHPAADDQASAASATATPREKPRRASMETGPVECDLCGKIYKSRSTLYSHKNRDHGVKASQQNKT